MCGVKVPRTITAKVSWPAHYEFLDDDYMPLIKDINSRIDPTLGVKILREDGEFTMDIDGERYTMNKTDGCMNDKSMLCYRLFDIDRETNMVPDSQVPGFFASQNTNALYISISKAVVMSMIGGCNDALFFPYYAFVDMLNVHQQIETVKVILQKLLISH